MKFRGSNTMAVVPSRYGSRADTERTRPIRREPSSRRVPGSGTAMCTPVIAMSPMERVSNPEFHLAAGRGLCVERRLQSVHDCYAGDRSEAPDVHVSLRDSFRAAFRHLPTSRDGRRRFGSRMSQPSATREPYTRRTICAVEHARATNCRLPIPWNRGLPETRASLPAAWRRRCTLAQTIRSPEYPASLLFARSVRCRRQG